MQKSLFMASGLFFVTLWCYGPPRLAAQTYPVKPLHILVGFTAGTAGDTTARITAQQLSEELGQQVVVENRTGASGSIANERVAASPADGYTLLLLAASGPFLQALRTDLPYHLERDFAPISLLATGTFMLVVHPSVPAHNVKELVALARSQPGKLNYGSSGVGTATHLAAELFNSLAKVNIFHVPYKGTPEFLIASAAGHIDMGFASVSPALPLLQAGKLRSIAITSAKRSALIPKIPTIDESGLSGYNLTTWHALLVPAGTPKDIVARLNAIVSKRLNMPRIKEIFTRQGLEPQTSTPEELTALIKSEIAQNAKLIKIIGLKPE